VKVIIPILVGTLLLAAGGGVGYVAGDRQGDSSPVVAAVPTVGPVPGSCDWIRYNCPNVPACAELKTRYQYLIFEGCAQPTSTCNCGY
jgi:hypothetical protein